MANPPEVPSKSKNVMKTSALILGAAGLFLFIVGVKRRHRLDEEREIEYARRNERDGD